MGMTSAQKMARLRARRRRDDRSIAAIEVDAEGRRRLVALGYLFPAAPALPNADALATAVQAYFSDKIAAEKG